MSEDIVARLRRTGDDWPAALVALEREAADEIERLRACDEQHYQSAKRTWQAIPDEFKLSPTDGGGIDEHFAIADMAKEIERLRAEVEQLTQQKKPLRSFQEIREEALKSRPLPDFWRVGQKVRYLESREFAWAAGEVSTIIGFAPDYEEGKLPASEYQVFYTSNNPKHSRFWTTPSDVELVWEEKP